MGLVNFGQPDNGIIQMDYVVEDLYRAMDLWMKKPNAGSWFEIFTGTDPKYRGKPTDNSASIAMSFTGHMTLLAPESFSRSSYDFLIFGVFSLLLSLVGTCTGEVWARFGRVNSRATEPKKFWELIATYYLGGACLIGYFFYRVYGLSN
jgi:hypothetical protein